MIYAIRTTVGRENTVVDTLASKIRNIQSNVKALLHPHELRGYLFVEGDLEEVERSISGLPHIRGVIKKEANIGELKKFLESKKIEVKIGYGDIVEITGGPFKNERGRVTRIDEAKDEVTLELLEAAIPIPTTISIDSVRVIEPAERIEPVKNEGEKND